jgi:class 3 adenylate cyclase/Tfp pilus assembly protein PilF
MPLSVYGQQAQRKIDSLIQAVNFAKSDTDKINVLLALSDAYKWSDILYKTRYAKEALQLADRVKWDKGIIAANIQLSGVCAVCNRDYTQSIKYAEKAASVAKMSGNKISEAHAINQIGNNYMQLSQYEKAIESYREVLALTSDPNVELSVLANMGVIYTQIADFPKAIACYDSSLLLLETLVRESGQANINDTLQEALLLITIADLYREMEDRDKALANYNKVLQLIKKVSARQLYLEILALKGIATAYYQMHNYDKAIEYYNAALNICIETDDIINKIKEETHINNQLGLVYLEMGDVAKAMTYAQRSLQQAEANNYQDLLPQNYLNMGRIYTALKDNKKAIGYLKKAIDHCKQSGALVFEKDALKALSDAYEQADEPALALDAFRQYKAIGDSLYSLNRVNEITRIDLKYEYDSKKFADSVSQAGNYQLKIQKQRVFTYSGFAGLAVVLVLAFFIYRNYSHQKKANILISKAKDAVDEEKEKSDALLLNILPVDVAMELKQHGDVRPKLFDNVTVLFTDFVSFTVAGDRLTPQQLVAELHACFKAFDVIIGKYKIEKIKTVGDAYLAVSGLPQSNANHAEDIVKAALEIRDFMAARRKQFPENTFEIRLGINSGPVVAGIVGVKKFAYDIWGDTVNVAARMEQYSQEGKVNISEKTYALVKDKFHCTDRGVLNVKNKGHMNMYFVEAIS